MKSEDHSERGGVEVRLTDRAFNAMKKLNFVMCLVLIVVTRGNEPTGLATVSNDATVPMMTSDESDNKVNKTRLYLGGFFSLGGVWDGSGILPAVEMALDHINERQDVLPEYELRMVWNDTQVSSVNYLHKIVPVYFDIPFKTKKLLAFEKFQTRHAVLISFVSFVVADFLTLHLESKEVIIFCLFGLRPIFIFAHFLKTKPHKQTNKHTSPPHRPQWSEKIKRLSFNVLFV